MHDGTPFTRDSLPAGEWDWLERNWIERRILAGEVLCQANATAGWLLLLIDAVTARIACGNGGALFEIGLDGPDSIAFAFAASSGGISPWQVQARRAGKVFAIPCGRLGIMEKEAPLFLSRCRQTAYAEVRQLAEQHAQCRRRSVRSLLAERLDDYFTTYGEPAIRITHLMLARRLDLRRATVTLALQELEGAHAIRSLRGSVQLKDREVLRAVARGS